MEDYKQKLEVARDWYKTAREQNNQLAVEILETQFPELKESEDEKIRKALIHLISEQDGFLTAINGINVKDILAWIEKQGHDGKKWIYEDVYLKEKEQIFQDGIDKVLENPQKYGLEKQGEKSNIPQDTEDDLRRQSTIQVLEYARSLDAYNQYGKEAIDKDIAWLEKKGSISKINEKLRQYREYLIKETESWHKKGEDETLSEIGRQDCIGHANAYVSARSEFEDLFNYDSWPKKQDKQKPIDKIEPKFKVGDWVTNGHVTYQIIDSRYWYSETCVLGNVTDIDKTFHIWTIEDAKDGDALAFDDKTIVIFKDLYNSTTFHSYCHIEEGVFNVTQDDMPDWWNGKGFHPATKEQCDILFQKMKESGYEWDAEKKELRKIKQKPIDKVEPKFKVGDWITNGKLLVGQVTSFDGKYYHYMQEGIEQPLHISNADNWHLWTIQDAKDGDVLAVGNIICIFKKIDSAGLSIFWTYCEVIGNSEFGLGFSFSSTIVYPATKEQRDILFQKMKEAGYEWDAENKKLKKIEQKPTWSEEDENMLKKAIKLLDEFGGDRNAGAYTLQEMSCRDCADWLKSLKDRMKGE